MFNLIKEATINEKLFFYLQGGLYSEVVFNTGLTVCDLAISKNQMNRIQHMKENDIQDGNKDTFSSLVVDFFCGKQVTLRNIKLIN